MQYPTAKEVRCERCKAVFTIPDVSVEVWNEIFELMRNDKRVMAVKLLADKSGPPGFANLGNAKATLFHFSRPGGVCVRCYSPLHEVGETKCAKCHSFNFSWSDRTVINPEETERTQ
jgi:phage FluMu protein Com